MARCSALVMFALLAGSSAILSDDKEEKSRPVTKIINMLKDMITQLEKEGEEDNDVYEQMGCWCETNDREKTKAIKDGSNRVNSLKASIESLTGNSARLNAEIANLDAEVAKNEEALDSATELRRKQLAEFNEEEKDMLSTITSLKGAVTALSKHHEASFLQESSGDMENSRLMAAVSVQHTLKRHSDLLAEVITPHQRKLVASLTQVKQPQSGEIFGVLQAMKESFEGNLGQSQKEETENNNAYEDLKAAKDSEISAGKSLSETKTQELATTDSKNAEDKQDLEDTQNTLDSDVAFLADVKAQCANLDAEYAERTKTRQLEIQAVNKALSFLTSDEAHDLFTRTFNFVQVRMSSEKRAAISKILLEAAKKSGDPALTLLATRTRLAAFTEIKKTIQEMVDNLIKEQKEEVEHRDFCIASLNTNERDTAQKNREKDDLEAKIEDLKMTIEELRKAIEGLEAAIKEAKVQMKRAGEDREKANAEYQVTIADQRATQKLLEGALKALKSFYDFGQTGHRQPSFKTHEKTNSGGVMGMIQGVITDAQKLEAEAIVAEEDSQKAYEDFVKETNTNIDLMTEDRTNKSEAKAKATVEKVESETEHDAVVGELSNLAGAASDLHGECDYMMKNFDGRQQARSDEIGALKQAIQMFSGASFGAFLQNPE